MKNLKTLFLLNVFLVSFLSCTTTSSVPVNDATVVYITKNNKINILPTESFTDDINLMQVIIGYYKDKTYEIQNLLTIDHKQISTIGISPLGNTLYDINYRNGLIEYNSIIEFNQISVSFMLADIQLCYYPEKQIKSMLEAGGLSLKIEETDNGWNRSIFSGDTLIISIQRKENVLIYKNFDKGYEYTIKETK